jgi:hypothetical protein
MDLLLKQRLPTRDFKQITVELADLIENLINRKGFAFVEGIFRVAVATAKMTAFETDENAT